MADSYWYIKNCDLFSQVSAEDVAWLESKSKMRKLKRGEAVYLPDDAADDILLVASAPSASGTSSESTSNQPGWNSI